VLRLPFVWLRPAHCGAAKGQLETLRILGTHGANLWVRNVRGDYPLHEAVVSGRKDLVLWLLTQRPDAVNSPNNDGRCPLHIAAINNNVEMCKVRGVVPQAGPAWPLASADRK
jgi:ankyrin repeat protein